MVGVLCMPVPGTYYVVYVHWFHALVYVHWFTCTGVTCTAWLRALRGVYRFTCTGVRALVYVHWFHPPRTPIVRYDLVRGGLGPCCFSFAFLVLLLVAVLQHGGFIVLCSAVPGTYYVLVRAYYVV
jgi:hypothetical protein